MYLDTCAEWMPIALEAQADKTGTKDPAPDAPHSDAKDVAPAGDAEAGAPASDDAAGDAAAAAALRHKFIASKYKNVFASQMYAFAEAGTVAFALPGALGVTAGDSMLYFLISITACLFVGALASLFVPDLHEPPPPGATKAEDSAVEEPRKLSAAQRARACCAALGRVAAAAAQSAVRSITCLSAYNWCARAGLREDSAALQPRSGAAANSRRRARTLAQDNTRTRAQTHPLPPRLAALAIVPYFLSAAWADNYFQFIIAGTQCGLREPAAGGIGLSGERRAPAPARATCLPAPLLYIGCRWSLPRPPAQHPSTQPPPRPQPSTPTRREHRRVVWLCGAGHLRFRGPRHGRPPPRAVFRARVAAGNRQRGRRVRRAARRRPRGPVAAPVRVAGGDACRQGAVVHRVSACARAWKRAWGHGGGHGGAWLRVQTCV